MQDSAFKRYNLIALWTVMVVIYGLISLQLYPVLQITSNERWAAILVPTLFPAMLFALSQRFRQQASQLPDIYYVAPHIVRLPIGFTFLFIMHPNGLIAEDFAIQAGWGDMAAGLGAVLITIALIVSTRPREGRAFVAMITAWTIFGALDFANVQRVVSLIIEQGRQDGNDRSSQLTRPVDPLCVGTHTFWTTHPLSAATCLQPVRRQAGVTRSHTSVSVC